MSNDIATKLIIENIHLLEQAKSLLEGEITEKLLTALDEFMKKEVEGYGDNWNGIFQFNGSSNLSFAPSEWGAKSVEEFKPQNYYGRYHFYCESNQTNEDGNGWWFTTFLQNDIEKLIISLYPWYSAYSDCSVKKWKAFAQEKNSLHPELELHGFKYNPRDGSWYLLIDGIEPSVMIDAYNRDDFSTAFEPIANALETVKKVHPTFDLIVKEAIKKFNTDTSEQPSIAE